MKAMASTHGDLRDRGVRTLFGDRATLDQRVAAYAAGAISEIVPYLDDVPDDELRSVLIRTCLHILRMPSRG
jgi:hypothetical protein